VSDIITGRLGTLRREMDELSEEFDSRKMIHSDVIEEIESEIADMEVKLTMLPCVGYGSYFQKQKSETEQRITELEKEKRFARLGFWKDRIGLGTQIRAVKRDYEQAVRRKEILNYYLMEGG